MLFQIFDFWRVGLRWDVFPEKLWLNRTVPYLISPLYGMYIYIYISYTYRLHINYIWFTFDHVALCQAIDRKLMYIKHDQIYKKKFNESLSTFS